MLKVTVLLCPGASETRSNPFSSLTGRVTELTRSLRYSWTISSPATLPVLVTVTLTAACPAGPIFSGATLRFE